MMIQMKRKFCLVSMMLMILLGMPAALADTASPAISVNGANLEMKAVVQEGSLYLPVRAVSEALGCEVRWSAAEQTVGIKAADKSIDLNLPDMIIKADNHEYNMLFGPLTIHYRTYMSEDFFSDELALQVQWDKKNNQVRLTPVKENEITIKTVRISSETKALVTSIQYPVIGGLADQQVQDGINAAFKSLADQAAAEGVKNAADLAPVLKEFPDMPGQCGTYFDYQIKYNQNNLISLVFQNYQYAGGAHGGTVQTAYTFNLKTGQRYALKDLFKADADYITVISSSVKRQLDERELTAALFEPFSKINAEQGYYLNNNGVVIFFQQYEILPYAAGIQAFDVDYLLLQDLLQVPELMPENLQVGDIYTVVLKGNPTTGFSWHYTMDNSDILQLDTESSTVDSNLIGAGSTFTWKFKALKAGSVKLIFKYYRVWEGESSTLPENIITYDLRVDD